MNANHLSKFLEFNFQQGPVGVAPYEWAHTYLKGHTSQQPLKALLSNLPKQKLNRNEVYQICASEIDVLFGYLCVMAWGNQGKPGPRHPSEAWESSYAISKLLSEIRRGLPRAVAYNCFTTKGGSKFKGLGPSFFTKLIAFFSKDKNAYIMDQWTARSINLLMGSEIVQLTSGRYVSQTNTGMNYEAFCVAVEKLTEICNLKNPYGPVQSAEEIEARLFSEGGKGDKAQPWRVYVRDHT
jgi:hypothetical protein